MLALAYLLQTRPEWTGARLALKTIVQAEAERDEATRRLQAFIADSRLEAEVGVLVQSGADVFETIREASQNASLIFLGMWVPQADETPESYSHYYRTFLAHTEGFPPTAMVLAAEEIEFYRIFR